MSAAAMFAHLLLERLPGRAPARVPEPCAVMADAAQVDAFCAVGGDRGVLAPIYHYHAVQAAASIRPGDRVLDLGCGPGNQLLHLARLHPGARFVGVDASRPMLRRARRTLDSGGAGGVALRRGDLTALRALPDAAFDCVTCTLSLHHLPDLDALHRAAREMSRVLRPGGGVYVADFGRLRRAATQRHFAHQRAAEQGPTFTADYFNSLRAAFSVAELDAALAALGPGVRRHQTALAPFMVVYRRGVHGADDAAALARARAALARLTPSQRRDCRALAAWFAAGGLPTPVSLR